MSKMRTPAMEKIEKKNAKRKKTVKSTPMRESWKRFKRNPTALIGLAVVCILILVAIFAPLIAPYDYKAQDYGAMMQAPSSLWNRSVWTRYFQPCYLWNKIFSDYCFVLYNRSVVQWRSSWNYCRIFWWNSRHDYHACHGYLSVYSNDHDGNVYRSSTWKWYSTAGSSNYVRIYADHGKK